MDLFTGRSAAILYYILMCESNYFTSEELAEKLECSSRTIKDEVKEIGRQLKSENAAELISTPGWGYQLHIIDSVKFSKIKLAVLGNYEFFYNRNLGQIKLRIYILKRILSSESLDLDDLMDELHLTYSALRKDFDHIKKIFRSYDLKLTTAKNRFVLKGCEYSKRVAMVETFCENYFDLDDLLVVETFNSMFYTDRQVYENIRHKFLDILRPTGIVIKDISAKKIAAYLCLINNRYHHEHRLECFDDSITHEIQTFKEFEIASRVLKELDVFHNQEVDEKEQIALACMILCHRDIDLNRPKDIELLPPIYLLKASRTLNAALEEMKKTVWRELFASELFSAFSRDFLSVVLSLTLRKVFGNNKKIELVTYSEVDASHYTPISIELSRVFIYHLEKVMMEEINSDNLPAVPNIFEYFLKQVNYEYKRQNIAIVSTSGRIVANYIANELQKNYSRFIGTLTILNLYEMRSLDFNDFDYVLCNKKDYYQNYPLKYADYSSLTNLDISDIYNQVFLNGYDRKAITFMIQVTKTINECICTRLDELMKLVCFRHGLENSILAMEQAFIDKNNLISYTKNNVVIMFSDIQFTGKEFIEIYRTAKFAKMAIIVSIDYGYDLSRIKMINEILDHLRSNDAYLEGIFIDTAETYEKIFNEIIANTRRN